MDLISTRRRTVTAKAEELVDAFEARYGRAPNGLERDRLLQQATLLTRGRSRTPGRPASSCSTGSTRRLRADIAGGLAGVAHTVLAARGDTARPRRRGRRRR